ncbi:MAG: hypothetical protein O3B31_03520, partial [Chloroflexi bacterium]|nr:hypothetical protein [Chloroflexota bacterium]
MPQPRTSRASRRPARRKATVTPVTPVTPVAAVTTIAEELLPLATASFREERVLDYVRRFAAARGLACDADRAGNLYVTHRRGRVTRPLVLTAHTDHPGFVVTAVRGRRLTLEFRGGLGAEYGAGERV